MMGSKGRVALEKRAVDNGCSHYWTIESPNGPLSLGVCKRCGEIRHFKNSIADFRSEDGLSALFEQRSLISNKRTDDEDSDKEDINIDP